MGNKTPSLKDKRPSEKELLKALSLESILQSLIADNSDDLMQSLQEKVVDEDPVYKLVKEKMPYLNTESYERCLKIIFTYGEQSEYVSDFFREYLEDIYVEHKE